MSLDDVILVAVLVNAASLFVAGLRHGPMAYSWALSGVLLAAVTLGAWALAPAWMPGIAVAAWVLLSGAPGVLRMAYVRALQRQDLRAAYRAARLFRALHPSAGATLELETVRGLMLNDAGRGAEAAAHLEAASRGAMTGAPQLRLQALAVDHRWGEALALLRAELGEAQLRLDPSLLVAWARTLGECGERGELVAFLRTHAALLESPYATLVRGRIRLYLFAFTGQRQRVERVLSTALAAMPAGLADVWRATAALVAGDADAARALLLARRDDPSAVVRSMVEDRLTRGLKPTVRAEGEEALLARQAELFEQEVRYGPAIVAGAGRPAQLTQAVAVLLAVAHVAAGMKGGWDADGELMRWGGLWGPAVLEAGEWWRVLTYQVLHAGHLHLALNLAGLWVLGREVERVLGAGRTALALVACGTAGGLLDVALLAAGLREAHFTVGASGAILGLAGVLAGHLLRGSVQHRAQVARGRLLGMATLVVAQTVVDLLTPEISLLVHATGMATGLLLGLALTQPEPEAPAAPATMSRAA